MDVNWIKILHNDCLSKVTPRPSISKPKHAAIIAVSLSRWPVAKKITFLDTSRHSLRSFLNLRRKTSGIRIVTDRRLEIDSRSNAGWRTRGISCKRRRRPINSSRNSRGEISPRKTSGYNLIVSDGLWRFSASWRGVKTAEEASSLRQRDTRREKSSPL